ncbi:CRISPR-associated endoribonuclease Cas6 [Paenibacillus cisolokensis]|uniref:CRISPR-associated endoribonuclease Cas6 n=1 Tax=Paenibacillus cisolokensis TaxID=1658519 RepID=UPI003D2B8B0D
MAGRTREKKKAGDYVNLTIQFYADKLPTAYRLMMVSIIKQCLRIADDSTYKKYYEYNRPKPFVFSVFLQDYKFGASEILLSGFRLNLSSSDYDFIVPFLNGLQRTTQFQYKGYSVRRGLIRYGREVRIRSSRIIVTTNSPILVEDENHTPLEPGSETYNAHLNRIADRISVSLRGRALDRELRMEPISVKKAVIKEKNEAFTQAADVGKTSGEYLFFTAYKGKFLLEGHPQDLQWLLETGIGLRSSQGFGHIQLEREVMMRNEA